MQQIDIKDANNDRAANSNDLQSLMEFILNFSWLRMCIRKTGLLEQSRDYNLLHF
jgi:hypothetical protein